MKKLILYITLSFITMFMSSCGGKTPSDILVGEWEIYEALIDRPKGIIWTLNKDGTMMGEGGGKWEVHGKESLILILFDDDGGKVEHSITIINDDKIELGRFLTLKRKNNVDKNN